MYKATVSQPNVNAAIAWAKENCTSYEYHQMVYNDPTHYDLLFTDEKEAILTIMRWR
mgnify:CR=1 FL=1